MTSRTDNCSRLIDFPPLICTFTCDNSVFCTILQLDCARRDTWSTMCLCASFLPPPPPPAAAKCADVCEALAQGDSELPEGDPVLVVGCDSMLEIDSQMLGKPHTPEVARERIRAMRRTSATLWTGHSAAILAPASSTDGRTGTRTVSASVTRSASTQVHFGDISDAEIDAYVATGEPLHVAGSFTVDGLGGPFIEGVTGDYHSVVGISLPLLRSMASELGVFWPNLWDAPRP